VRVPPVDGSATRVDVRPRLIASGQGFIRATVKTPGSAAVVPLGAGRFRALVCSDQWNFITSHILTPAGRMRSLMKASNSGAAPNTGWHKRQPRPVMDCGQ